jgi:4'-phosphopantetheinyl transferase
MPTIAPNQWAPGPTTPLLEAGAVHVWRAELEAVGDDVCELLCERECERAERMLDAHGRQLWRRSRGVLRALLGRYLERDPRSLRLVVGAHGKPALEDRADRQRASVADALAEPVGLSFNLSHSRGLALYAFSRSGPVGVDVEAAHSRTNELGIAARVLGAAEAQRLERLRPQERSREFLRAWARHEAQVKCIGVGIGGADSACQGPRPWVAQLELGPHAAGAVAAERQAHQLCCWQYAPTDSGG